MALSAYRKRILGIRPVDNPVMGKSAVPAKDLLWSRRG
jgi:hypothetical protein